MVRLIDVDKLKQYIDDCECCKKCDKIGFMCNDDCELPDFLTPQWERVLNEQPTVDADPVRHGKWYVWYDTEDGRMLRCSECQMVFWVGSGREGNYCPNCGAKMDAEQEKQNESD